MKISTILVCLFLSLSAAAVDDIPHCPIDDECLSECHASDGCVAQCDHSYHEALLNCRGNVRCISRANTSYNACLASCPNYDPDDSGPCGDRSEPVNVAP